MKRTLDIILCCYKQELTIEKALRSIYIQRTPRDFKAHVLIADDCSPDKTLEIINSIKCPNQDFDIEILRDEHNLGMCRNYERAFAKCYGEYVFILEGDDWWSSDNHLIQHVEFLEEHSDISMTSNRLEHYNENSGQYSSLWKDLSIPYLRYNVHDQIQWNILGNLSSCCFRGEYIRQLPNSLHELHFADYLLGIIMAEKGDIAVLQESTSVYRVVKSAQWSGKSNKQRRMAIRHICEQYDKYFSYKYKEDFAIFNQLSHLNLKFTWRDFVPIAARRIGKLILGML